jgi:HD-GYP domain-containing protein (c-di-GMP phosphodiesterase class II)
MKLPASIKEKDTKNFTPTDWEEYQKHPRLGAEMLREIPDINYQVVQIVYQHHERLHGAGYPNKLTAIKIYPLAKIVALADDFSDFLVEKRVSPLEGIKLFLQDREKLLSFDQAIIRALVSGFIKEESKP